MYQNVNNLCYVVAVSSKVSESCLQRFFHILSKKIMRMELLQISNPHAKIKGNSTIYQLIKLIDEP